MSFRKVAVLFFVTACSSATRGGNGAQLTGAAEPKLAAEQFLRAVKANDLQAISTVWGTQNGPARETMERTSMEKREIILVCYLTHDTSRVVDVDPPHAAVLDHPFVLFEEPELVGPGDRWYVENVDIAAVRDFCGNPGTSAGR